MIVSNLNIESYIEKVTGKVPDLQSIPMDQVHGLSLHLRKSYQLYQLRFLEKDLVLVQSHTPEPLSPTQAIKILKVFKTKLGQEVVLVLDKLPAYLRSRYVAQQVPFIVPDQQLFIPQLLIDLNDTKDHRQEDRDYFRPATQCMILYHLLIADLEGLSQNAIAEKLGYSNMTISRAVTECEDKGIIVKNSGLKFKYDSKELWLKAKDYMQSPISKVIYSDNLSHVKNNIKSGMIAMSHYTDLAADENVTVALSQNQYKQLLQKNTILDDRYGKLKIEVWDYNPAILTSNKYADRLSLFLTMYDDDNDARTSKALEKLIDQLYD